MRSVLVRNSATLLSGNVIAQVIGMAVYPILTRLYAPEDFGLVNLMMSLSGIIVLLSTAEFNYAVVLPRDDKKAWSIMQCGIVVLVVITLLTFLSSIFSGSIARLCNTPEFAHWYPTTGIYIFSLGAWTMMNYWYTRKQKFGVISRYQMCQSVTSSVIKIGLGLIPYSGGLMIGTIFAPLISLITNWFSTGRRAVAQHLNTPFRRTDLIKTAQEYRNFPCYNLPRSLVNNMGSNLPSLLLAPVFGLSELGFFGMAITLAFRPINMISSSIYQVLFQHFSENVNHSESISNIYRKYLTRAALVAIPGFSVLWFILPWLCELLLGEEWRISGEYIRWMLPWLLCSLMVAPICSLSDVFGEQKKGFLFEILLFIGRIGGISIGLLTHNMLHSVIGYSLGNTIVMMAQLVWYTGLVYRYEASRQTD